MTNSQVLHSALFKLAAESAYGEGWVAAVSEALNVNDRTIRRIAESARTREENAAAIALLFPFLEHLRGRRNLLTAAIEIIERNATARVMRDDQYAVLRWIATDDLGPLHGYDGSLGSCVRAGWVHGSVADARMTAAGCAAYETELEQRRTNGLPLDIDPLRIAPRA